MQIFKGQVEYKGRKDIICKYMLTDDGNKYYFLEGYEMPNDNIVVSSVLVEAIDSFVPASNVGVINSKGEIVIPLNNKSIKVVNDLILAEVSKPISESVINANLMKNSSSELISTAAVIKEKMYAKMGTNGRFVFNDQFSEASLYDMLGNNILNNELYSFIGVTSDKIYLCKNTKDSNIDEYDLVNKIFVPYQEVNKEPIDISNNTVTIDDINNAVNNTMFEDITANTFEQEIPVYDFNKANEEMNNSNINTLPEEENKEKPVQEEVEEKETLNNKTSELEEEHEEVIPEEQVNSKEEKPVQEEKKDVEEDEVDLASAISNSFQDEEDEEVDLDSAINKSLDDDSELDLNNEEEKEVKEDKKDDYSSFLGLDDNKYSHMTIDDLDLNSYSKRHNESNGYDNSYNDNYDRDYRRNDTNVRKSLDQFEDYLKDSFTRMNNENKDLREEVREANRTLEDLDERLRKANELIKELTRNNDNYKDQVEDLERELEKATKNCYILDKELKDERERCENLADERDNLQREVNNLSRENKRKEEIINTSATNDYINDLISSVTSIIEEK